DFRVMYVNRSGASALGMSAEDATGKHLRELFPPDTAERMIGGLFRVFESGKPLSGEMTHRFFSGDFHSHVSLNPIFDEDGKVVAVAGTSRDINDLKKAEEALRASEERLRLCAATARFGTFEWDLARDGHVWSPETYEIYGVRPGTPLTLDYLKSFIYPGDQQDAVLAAGLDPAGPGEYTMEYRIVRASDGEVRWVYVRTRVLFEGAGAERRAVRILGAIQDITERKRAEEALRQSEEKFRSLADSSQAGIALIQGERFVYVNQALADMGGYTVEEILSTNFWNFIHSDFAELVRQRGIAAQREGKIRQSRYEVKIIRKDGGERWLDFSPGLIQYNGAPALIVTAIDITERKRAEEALRESEEKFRLLAETSPAAIFICSRDQFFYANPATESIIGYGRDELAGMSPYDVIDLEDRENLDKVAAGQLRKIRHLSHYEAKVRTKDGRERWMDNSATVIKYEDRLAALVVAFDITERKRAEEALRTTLQRFYTILSNMHGAILLVTGEGRIEYANDTYCGYFNLGERPADLIGLTAPEMREKNRIGYRDPDRAIARIKEIVERWEPVIGEEVALSGGRTCLRDFIPLSIDGKRYGRLWHYIDITERKRAEDVLRRHQFILAKSQETAHLGNWAWNVQTDELNGSLENLRMTGYSPGEASQTMRWFMSLVHPADREMVKRHMETALREGRTGSIDYCIVRKDGAIVYVNTVTDKIVRDPAGRVKWVYGINQDITERKKIEEKLAIARDQAELYLDLMGHDINNMNMIAAGFLEMARNVVASEGKLDAARVEFLDKAMTAINNSSALIGNVRKLQRGTSGEYRSEVYDLGSLIEEVCGQYKSVPGGHVNISCDALKGFQVRANELLRDVFINLIDNAIKHSTGLVFINVRMGCEERNDRQYCTVTVDDNGPGIPDGMKDQIFDRLRRGETNVRGSGLGLYLVRSLVEGYGGKVRVEDRVKGDHTQGALFVVMLPLV
ncbi:MAG TPA: PAS domain S-box protein, partial [Methanocella sp.]|nr:PAS domain S-box protein [Methanocella sp.]